MKVNIKEYEVEIPRDFLEALEIYRRKFIEATGKNPTEVVLGALELCALNHAVRKNWEMPEHKWVEEVIGLKVKLIDRQEFIGFVVDDHSLVSLWLKDHK